MKDELVFVALGSNLGRARETLCRAMDLLQELSLRPLLRSCLYVTAPVDCPPGSPDFLNAVVGLAAHPEETPESMIGRLQALEKEFGRQPKLVLNEPRPLDLDLIVFGSEVRPGPALILPHPRAHERPADHGEFAGTRHVGNEQILREDDVARDIGENPIHERDRDGR